MAAPRNENLKQRILFSAEGLLREKAFADITLADIARASGVSKGTLYYYYSSKDDILFDVTELYLERMSHDLVSWADDPQKDTSAPRFINYIFERGIFNEASALRLCLIGAAAAGHEEVRIRLVEKYIHFKNAIAARLVQRLPDADGEYAAWMILTLLDGILIQEQLKNGEFDAGRFIKSTVEIMCETGGEDA